MQHLADSPSVTWTFTAIIAPTLLALVEIPAIREGDPEPDRCDYFTLCDLRPLGHKPQILHSHVPLIHLPSLLADAGIQLPSAYRVCVAGATLRGDHVRVRGHSTIVVYARLNTFDSDDSSEHSWPSEDSHEVSDEAPRGPPPPAPIHAGHHVRDARLLPRDVPLQERQITSAPSHALSDEHSFLDATLPAGHSWNSGIDELFGAAPDLPRAHGSDAYPAVPQDTEVVLPRADADDSSVTLLALVYAPEFLPEVLYSWHCPALRNRPAHSSGTAIPCSRLGLLIPVSAPGHSSFGEGVCHLSFGAYVDAGQGCCAP